MDFSKLLQSLQSHDIALRGPAEKQLAELEAQNFPMYLKYLCVMLATTSESGASRQLAGILLKNTLVSNDEHRKHVIVQRWMMLPGSERNEVKNSVVTNLSAPFKEVRSIAAQIIAAVAAIELQRNMWPNLIDYLLRNVVEQSDDNIREAALECLGYVCEVCSEALYPRSSDILNVISGCVDKRNSNSVKLAAVKALGNSLEFARNNMASRNERQIIMAMIFDSTQSTERDIRLHGFLALVKVAYLYYDILPEYLESIFQHTQYAVQKDEDVVVLQAIEVWSTICDVERDIKCLIADECLAPSTLKGLIKTALPHLLPVLYECLVKQSEHDFGNDNWNVATAAGTCLGLCALVATESIVGLILPFIRDNITHSNWRRREAATLVFGSVLEGPSKESLVQVITAAFDIIMNHIRDENPHVRDTTAWTIGRLCKFQPECLSPQMCHRMMELFSFGLALESRIASLMCWSIHSFAMNIGSQFVGANTSPLSAYFKGLIEGLLQASIRDDADEAHLLSSSFEAINALIEYSAEDVREHIIQLFPLVMQRLQESLAKNDPDDIELQGLLCGTIQVIVTKLKVLDEPVADQIMGMMLQCLRSKNPTLFEESLMVIASVANCVQEHFTKYMGVFFPFLMGCLQNVEDRQVNQIAIGVVSDLCHAMGPSIFQVCDEIISVFLQNLQSDVLERSIKPYIISCLGDISLVIKGNFTRYLQYVMLTLVQASGVQFPADENNIDDLEYLNSLRLSILEAYTGILAGLSESGVVDEFASFVPHITTFLELVASDTNRNEEVLNAAVGVVGDMAFNLGGKMDSRCLKTPQILKLTEDAMRSSRPACQESGEWARNSLERLQ